MAEPIRLAVIGCGRILAAHLNGLKTLWDHGRQDFRVVALCARQEEDALRYRRRGEGPPPRPPIAGLEGDPLVAPHLYVSDLHEDLAPAVFTDWRAMFADDSLRLDGVLLYTPVATHHEIALAAIEAGLHVFCEKPLAITVAAGRRMVAAAEAAGVQLAVAEVVRFHPVVRMARWCLDEGLLGRLQFVVQLGLGMIWSPDRVRADTPWRHQRRCAGGGLTLDRGVHVVHELEYLCGPIETVAARAACLEPVRRLADADGVLTGEVPCDVDDTFVATLQFASGALGQVAWSAALHGERSSLPQTLYGSQGSLRLGRIVDDAGGSRAIAGLFRAGAPRELTARWFPDGVEDPFALELASWLEAVAGRWPCEVAGEVGVRDLAAAYALLESSDRGGEPVAVAEVVSGRLGSHQAELDRRYKLV